MKRKTIGYFRASIMIFMVSMSSQSFSQDTFSIVAIDSVTGEIGSAGASCVGSSSSYPHGAQILSDVIPGIGAIHTQASWSAVNQQHAHDWMMLGLSPQQIIDSLVAHDAGSNPAIRQYGIVDYFGGHPRSAAFTGTSCTNYKNDTAHLNYSIQGNILMGQQILDSMQSRFLNTPGPLSDRLMAALQGAKVIGADTRCAIHGTSSQSSFIRVGKMTDPPDSLYLDLWMAYPSNLSGIYPVDPIDSLQTLYNIWKTSTGVKDHSSVKNNTVRVYCDKEGFVVFDLAYCRDYKDATLFVYDISGKLLTTQMIISRVTRFAIPGRNTHEMLVYRIVRQDQTIVGQGKFIR
ncbi:MAG: DUF1028 domain-containing protein [Bacteroidetes bacterium]|nr:DUF1028 domain-containing protein [Bacteroidota bacterium]